MNSATKRTERRGRTLSRERIVETAIEILDSDGEGALTFRALATRLATGSGAIYWHIADKDELLSAATEAILSRAMAAAVTAPNPRMALRSTALSVFDTIEAHPWVGTQLAREPSQPAMVELFERSCAQFEALGVPDSSLFHCVSALAHYLLGTAAQSAAAARLGYRASDRPAVLTTIVARWTERDPAEYPFVHKMAAQLREHDEREAFLAGIDLILAGAESVS
jgi:AcrR family transcriptional regulator